MKLRALIEVVICAGLIAILAERGAAQEAAVITLKSLDGSVVMTGELQGFEAGYYNIVVAGLGLVSIAVGLVTCQFTRIDCAALLSRF